MRHRLASMLVAALVAGSAAHAQQQPGIVPLLPQAPQLPEPAQNPQPQFIDPAARVPQGLNPNLLQRPGQQIGGTDQVWSAPALPGFEGFPVFPSRLPGFGNYPVTSEGGESLLPGLFLPPAPSESGGWPAWARTRARAPLPFAPDLALLVRETDRVWWRENDAEPFVPLFFHDKLRTLGAGAEVLVRQTGEFEMLLHDSTRLVAHGPTRLSLRELDEQKVAVDFAVLTHVDLYVRTRTHTIGLPDGSRLSIAGGPDEQGLLTPGRVRLRRADEPEWLGGRATLTNLGELAVVWQHAFGEVVLRRNQQLTLLLTPPRAPVPVPLEAEGASVDLQPDRAVAQGGGEGSWLSWCGARFALGSGRLVLEPLQGEPFAPAPEPQQR